MKLYQLRGLSSRFLGCHARWAALRFSRGGVNKELIFLVMMAGLCSPVMGASDHAGGPLAEIDGQVIRAADFEAELAQRRLAGAQKEALLDEMVQFELAYAAAKRVGLDRNPEILASFRRMIVGRYLQEQLEPRLAAITVTDAEAEQYYASNREDFRVPGRSRAAVVRITIPPHVSEARLAKLTAQAAQARQDALALPAETQTFGSVAVRYSEDQASRYRGGDMGWLDEDPANSPWPAEVAAYIANKGVPGEVSPVITTADGHYLVKVMERQPSAYRPYEEVKDWARHQMHQAKRRAVEQAFYAELKQALPVTIDRAQLDAVPEPAAAVPQPPPLPRR